MNAFAFREKVQFKCPFLKDLIEIIKQDAKLCKNITRFVNLIKKMKQYFSLIWFLWSSVQNLQNIVECYQICTDSSKKFISIDKNITSSKE